VTSHDFEFSALFNKPNPLVVLRDSNDGDKRAKAFRALQEPLPNSGSVEEQNLVMEVLCKAVVTEHQSLCRLAAIEALGRCKDPRAVQALEDAYYQAAKDGADHTYPPETATAIQIQAIAGLGKTRNAKAVAFLIRVVGDRHQLEDGASKEQQQALDIRIAAARSLSAFSQYQATEALVHVMETDKDVALRDSARDSLVKVTGKDIPADPEAWKVALRASERQDGMIVPQKDMIARILDWLDWSN
jgi:hypothetical protein